MSKIFPVENNFTAGILSPLAQARVDTKAYANGLKQCENFIILPHGGVVRRGGFAKIAQAKTDAGTARLIPFMFSTSPENSYVLEFDGTAGAEVIRVYSSAGAYVTEVDASSWFDAADVLNIRYAQSADVLYMVDGVHKVHKLTRSGTVAAPSFALTEANLVGNPYSSAVKKSLKIYRINYAVWATWAGSNGISYANASTFASLFRDDTQYAFLEKSCELEDSTYGILFGEPISSSSEYNNEDDTWKKFIGDSSSTIYKNLTTHNSTYNYAFDISSTIYAPSADEYHFGLNCDSMGDLSVDEKIVVNARSAIGASSIRTLKSKDNPAEFSEKGSIQLTQGSHPINARFTVHSNSSWSPSRWGIGVAWRRGYGPYYNGTTNNGTGNALLSYDYNVDNSDWHGNTVFEIKIKASPNGTKFGWTWREMTTHPEDMTAEWPSESVQESTWNTKSPVGWAVKPTDADGADWSTSSGSMYELKSHPSAPTYMFGAFYMPSATQIAGDSWIIRVGFQPIPSSWFRNTPVSGEAYYPSNITFHQNRMWLAGFSGLPLVRASKTGDFENFDIGANDNDALEFSIASAKIDTVRWMKSGRKMILGTTGSEYVVDASSGVITPSDIMVIPHTFYGSDKVDPVQVENSILFVEKNGVRIRDYVYRYDTDGYIGDDQSIISYEEIKDGIKEMVFQQAGQVGFVKTWTMNIPPVNIVWVVTDQNQLKAFTFEKQHNVIAWHKHTLGTLSTAAQVQSIAVIPGTGGDDELWALVSRPSHRWIERLGKTISHDSNGGSEAASFTATLETLPLLMDNEGQTIRSFKKRWVRVNAVIYAGQNISFAEGSETFATEKQTLDAATTAGQNDVDAGSTGWDTESTLVFKSEPDASDICYPCVITAIHGKVQINES